MEGFTMSNSVVELIGNTPLLKLNTVQVKETNLIEIPKKL